MLYYDFNVGDKTYKLRLNTRNVVVLEKALGGNPLSIFGNGDTIPSVTSMVAILHSALQQYEHGITLDKAYAIYDEWLEDGHTMTDFLAVIIEVYKVSGIIKDDTEEKNA